MFSSDLLGNVAVTNAAEIGVDSLVRGIKGIVDVKEKGNADAGTDKKAKDGNTARKSAAGDGEVGKLFTAVAAG
ncbi:variable large family protein [Borrelia turicatae]|uniref:variable large family protein n=1 Tax=Borrelia turicatae TaxID=142 RepID=UPI003D7C979F